MSFISRVRGQVGKKLENESKQKECMTLCLEREQRLQAKASLCIFTTGASLASYAPRCQILVYTASARSCNYLMKNIFME